MAARRVTIVSLVLAVVGKSQPISVVGINAAIPGVDRRKLYGTISTLCRNGLLEVRGHIPRPDGIGSLALYGRAGARVVASRARDPGRQDPAALAAAELYWSRTLLAVGTAPFNMATQSEIAQMRELKTHGTTTESA
jgi:hypothetical protein